MSVSLSGALPKKGDLNGLPEIFGALLQHPDQVRLVVAAVKTKTIKTDVESGERTPTISIVAIEPIQDADEIKQIGRILRECHELRTGRKQLPIPGFEDDDLDRATNGRVLDLRTATGVHIADDPDGGDRG